MINKSDKRTTVKTSKKQHILNIKNIYHSIVRIMEGENYIYNFIQQCREDEKRHRRCRPSSITKKFGLTVDEATAYFVCRWILLGKRSKPEAKDYLWTRKELFVGYALYHNYKVRLSDKRIFDPRNTKMIDSFDYAEYI